MKPTVIIEGNRVAIYKNRKPTFSEKKRDANAIAHGTTVIVQFSQGKPRVTIEEHLYHE